MNHINRSHPGEELKYRRVTPQGEVIMDDKTSIGKISLTPSKDKEGAELN